MSDTSPPVPTSTLEYYQPLPLPEGPPPRQRYWLHGLLLVLTCFTTLVVGSRMEYSFQHNLPQLADSGSFIPLFPVEWAVAHPSRLLLGIPFASTLLLILLAHEMGHYLMCRYYGVHATLPFFFPAPTLIGTLGAVIRIKAPIRSRAALFDIGIAGPIAGFVVAVGALIISMVLSKPMLYGVPPSEVQLGFPAIFHVAQSVMRGVVPGNVVASLPLSRVYLHPTAIAAWVGMYATALNLLPSGQLDGGHIVYALAPRAHRVISLMTVVGLICLGTVAHHSDRSNYSWWIWAGLIAVMNILTYRQEQAPDEPPIPPSRSILAVVAAIMLALTFTMAPFHMNW